MTRVGRWFELGEYFLRVVATRWTFLFRARPALVSNVHAKFSCGFPRRYSITSSSTGLAKRPFVEELLSVFGRHWHTFFVPTPHGVESTNVLLHPDTEVGNFMPTMNTTLHAVINAALPVLLGLLPVLGTLRWRLRFVIVDYVSSN